MSDFITGLKIATATVFAAYMAWILLPALPDPPFKAEKVVCFPMPSIAGRMPAIKSALMQLENAPTEAEHQRSVMQTYHSSVREAELACTPDVCEAADLKKYRSALRQYILTRENITRNLFRERGDGGLAYAEDIFNTPVDDEIIEHLQALVATGLFDLATLREAKQSAALLTLKPVSAYLPCADDTPREVLEQATANRVKG